ncbi:hypothetical protein BDK51DRAFT_47100 [Blyttiomyces helicus]|uniref:Uncharacterized protein n=1 Tax=Blyttiomyces helicus TaxID=388810 RepID=A0A4P9W2B4_9FUNG|nr:hypothetical protein BDK51DRAFT_47100 [Blyttiomyces helicus]|eukprot:RKO86284.1 hypothetical protein BDK51DRAFT_47100 [Blyttiomyces helicus]
MSGSSHRGLQGEREMIGRSHRPTLKDLQSWEAGPAAFTNSDALFYIAESRSGLTTPAVKSSWPRDSGSRPWEPSLNCLGGCIVRGSMPFAPPHLVLLVCSTFPITPPGLCAPRTQRCFNPNSVGLRLQQQRLLMILSNHAWQRENVMISWSCAFLGQAKDIFIWDDRLRSSPQNSGNGLEIPKSCPLSPRATSFVEGREGRTGGACDREEVNGPGGGAQSCSRRNCPMKVRSRDGRQGAEGDGDGCQGCLEVWSGVGWNFVAPQAALLCSASSLFPSFKLCFASASAGTASAGTLDALLTVSASGSARLCLPLLGSASALLYSVPTSPVLDFFPLSTPVLALSPLRTVSFSREKHKGIGGNIKVVVKLVSSTSDYLDGYQDKNFKQIATYNAESYLAQAPNQPPPAIVCWLTNQDLYYVFDAFLLGSLCAALKKRERGGSFWYTACDLFEADQQQPIHDVNSLCHDSSIHQLEGHNLEMNPSLSMGDLDQAVHIA